MNTFNIMTTKDNTDTYKFLYSYKNNNETVKVDDFTLSSIVQQYTHNGRMMGLMDMSEKTKRKMRKIIYISLETTKLLLKHAVKRVIGVIIPGIAKELTDLGIDVIVKLIDHYLDKEKFKEFKKEKDSTFKKISNGAVKVIEMLFGNADNIIKKQNKKLKNDIKVAYQEFVDETTSESKNEENEISKSNSYELDNEVREQDEQREQEEYSI